MLASSSSVIWRGTAITAIATAVALFDRSPAHAAMPYSDVKAYCATIASIGGTPSEMMRQGCYREEQSSYDALKPIWDALPADERRYCDQIARIGGGGSYMMLKGCVDEENAAGRQNQDFQFRR